MESRQVIFIGGIHGVGKGTICRELERHFLIETVSASELLKWSEVSKVPGNKAVQNISDTQERLISGFNQLKGSNYIIDGHFTLFDKDFNVIIVPDEVFQRIKPIHMCIIIDEPKEVAQRLLKRDGIIYDLNKLKDMQLMELDHAKYLSERMNTPLTIIKNGNIKSLLETLEKVYQKRVVGE
jgi:adenylate kinase